MSTKDNPADQLTRGIPTEKLKESSLWWHGLQWLPQCDKWPEDMKFGKIDNCSEKATILTINPQPIKLMEWERFGSYDKGMRVLAWILRFKNNLSAKISDSAVTTNSRLNVKELRAAEFELYKLVQKESYPQEYKVLKKKDDKNFYTRGHQTFFTEGRITERMTSEGRIIIPFNTCKPERKLWEKKTTN